MAKRLTWYARPSEAWSEPWPNLSLKPGEPPAGITGTDGDDNLVGTNGDDVFEPLLGSDTVNGLGGIDTLIVDYVHAPYDPYAGASFPGDMISTISSTNGSLNGAISGGGAGVHFSNIEKLHISFNFWQDRVVIDAAAAAFGAALWLDGGRGVDTLQIDLSSYASVSTQTDATGLTGNFGTFLNFEWFALNLTAGADDVTTGAGSDTLAGNGGDDVLNSGAGNDILSGGSGSNVLNAGSGDDQIISIGIDTVDGGTGFDRWSGNYGWLTADFSMSRNSAAGSATLSIGTTLTGIERIESLVTGSGNDVFVVVGQGEGFSIDAGTGQDRLTLTGSGFSGDLKADGAGAFKGFLGYDRFTGIEFLDFLSGAAPDVISVDAAPLLSGATLKLDAAAGSDTLILDLTAYASISFVVAPDGTLTTNVPATFLNFENYQLSTGAGADYILTGAGNDVVHGNAGNDTITTGAGNDLLDGGAGADSLIGGAGDDIYIVTALDDTITELAGEGTDEIRTSLATFSMAALAAIEDLTGTSDTGQSLTGNALANRITGGAGDDYLIGFGGADLLQGRAGNDTYLVTDAAAAIFESDGWGTDTVYTTVSYVLTLTNYAEIETFSVYDQSSTNAIDLTGNTRNQSIFGNAGANVLVGGGGTDILYGLGGDDSYVVDSSDDQVIEASSGGSDTISAFASYALASGSEVERLTAHVDTETSAINLTGNEFGQRITGNAGNNILRGLGGNDLLEGGAGNDRLYGGSGNDQLVGGAGADKFVFETPGDSLSYSLRSDGHKIMPDVIVDFASGTDKIDLGGIDAIVGTAANDAFTFIGSGSFTHQAGQVRFETSDGRTNIYADLDGDGLADMQILLLTPTTLTASDFML